MSNRDTIRMHLEEYVRECRTEGRYKPDWVDVMSFCLGYYGDRIHDQTVATDILMVIRQMQREEKIAW